MVHAEIEASAIIAWEVHGNAKLHLAQQPDLGHLVHHDSISAFKFEGDFEIKACILVLWRGDSNRQKKSQISEGVFVLRSAITST